MLGNVLVSVGLAVDIVGVVMLAHYGLPGPVDENGRVLSDIGVTFEPAVALARSYQRRSKVALGLIIGGFGLQLVGVWV